MITYQQLKREPAAKDLFDSRITTLEGLHHAIRADCAFIALDTEHAAVQSAKDRILYQVGLAFLSTIKEPSQKDVLLPKSEKPHLRDFYIKQQVRSLTLDVAIDNETKDSIVYHQGSIPTRRASRFSEEHRVPTQELEGVIGEFIQSCDSTQNLILIGFEMAAEWTYLFRFFPRVLSYFSSWVDLRDITKDITPAGVMPGQVSLLQLCGYHWTDIKQGNQRSTGYGTSDNAGNDAVSTLALMNALLDPDIQEKLKFRQKYSEIAGPKKRHQDIALIRDSSVTAIIQSKIGLLPATLNSSMKLARYFFSFNPKSTGIISSSKGYITFMDAEQLGHFIQFADGSSLPTGEILSVGPLQDSMGWKNMAEAQNSKIKEKKEWREKKKLLIDEKDIDDIGDLFY